MLNTSLERTPSNLRVFTVCLLLFAFVITPIASLATPRALGAVVKEKPATKEESKTADINATASEVFANPLAPRPEPAPAPAPLPVGAVTASMTATIANDDGDNKIDPTNGNPGTTEKINYSALLSNTSGAGATGLSFNVPVDSHTSLIAGSLNSTPVAFDQSVSLNEDATLVITLQGQDPDGSNITFKKSDGTAFPSNPTTIATAHGTIGNFGSLTCDANGVCSQQVTYTPAADYNGSDSFSFKANDNTANSNENGVVTITVNPVNDAPTFTVPGNPPAVNEDAGVQNFAFITPASIRPAQSGNSSEDTQTVNFVITNVTHSALFTAGGQPTLNVSNSGNQPFPLTANLTYTPAPNANGTSVVTYHLHDNGGTANSGVDNSADQTFTITVNAVNDAPVAQPKAFTVQSNMKITGLTGLLSGVTDADATNGAADSLSFDAQAGYTTPSVTLTSVTLNTCTNGTISNVQTNGTFDFDPPPGLGGGSTCVLNYQVTDTKNPGPGVASANQTITITAQGPVIWFVDPNRTNNGNGTLSNAADAAGNPGPFKNLSSAQAKLDTLATNQKVFVYSGTTPSGAGEIVDLKANNDWLVGQGTVATSFDSFFGLTAGNAPPAGTITRPTLNSNTTTAFSARPTISGTVTMRNNTQVTGVNIVVTGSNKGLTSAGFSAGTSLIKDVSVTSATGNGVDLSSGTQTVTYETSDGTNSPNVLISVGGAALTVSSGATIGANGFTFKSISANGGANGIVLNSTGATAGLTVTGTGTTAGSGGTIQNCTAKGADIRSASNISLSNMNFTNNATANLGASGTCGDALNGTNGPTNCNANIAMSSVTTATLTKISATGSKQIGIDVKGGSNLTLTNLTVTGNGNETMEDGVQITDLTGTLTVAGGLFKDNAANQFEVQNGVTGPLSVIVGTSTFSNTAFPTGATTPANTTSNSGLFLATHNSAVMNPTITNNVVDRIYAQGIRLDMAGSSSMTANIGPASGAGNGNTITNSNQAISVTGSNTGGLTYNIRNNSASIVPANVAGGATNQIGVARSTASGTWTGLIENNTVGTLGTANSGCQVAGCDGIDVVNNSAGTHKLSILGNTIRETEGSGMVIIAGGAPDNSNVSWIVKNNTISNPEQNAGQANPAILIQSGTSVGTDTSKTCLEISGNTISGTWSLGTGHLSSIRVRSLTTAAGSFAIVGFNPATEYPNDPTGVSGSTTGAVGNVGNVADYIRQQNPGVTNASPGQNAASATQGAAAFSNSGGCPLLLAEGGVMAALNAPSLISSVLLTAFEASPVTVGSGIVVDPSRDSVSASLTQAQLDSIVASAGERWIAAGLSAQQISIVRNISFEVADLDGAYLGEAIGNRVQIDRNAAGKGWFVGLADSEFGREAANTRLYTDSLGAPAGHVDLLTAIMHEMGHKLGLDDSYAGKDRNNLMYGYLTVGERRLPTLGQARSVDANSSATVHHLILAADDRASKNAVFANVAGEASGIRSVAGYLAPFVPMFSGGTFPVNGLNNNGFTLPTGKTTTITFSVTLNNPPSLSGVPPATPTVSNQGTLSGSFTGNPLLTDDPTPGGATDPTVTNVDLFNTTSTITGASPSNSTNTGQSVTFTASIVFSGSGSPAPASGSPTGTANFRDNGTSIPGCGSAPVSAVGTGTASAQCVTSSLSTAVHNNITVVYSGDGSYDTSTSAAFTQTVTQSGTTTAVLSSANPSFVSQNVTFTAQVTSTGAVSPPTGTVQFHEGATNFGAPVALTSGGACPAGKGCASFSKSDLAAGPHTIAADYIADPAFTGSSGSVSQQVNQSDVTVTVLSSQNPSLVTQSVTFTAQLNSNTAIPGPPTGTIQFHEGATNFGAPVALTTGGGCPAGKSCATSIAVSSLAAGTHTITADYNGDTNFAATNGTLSGGQVVNKSDTTTALQTDGTPSTVGNAVKFTATVTSQTAVAGPPAGKAQFFDGATPITCTGAGESNGSTGETLNGSGVATCTTTTLTTASHSITATYTGDGSANGSATFNGSTSNTVTQVVNPACTAAVTVINPNDTGAGSLRQAIADVCDGGAITFSSNTIGGATNFYDGNPHTISLLDASGELLVNKTVTITGSGSSVLTVKRDNTATTQFRVFEIAAAKTVTISGMTISNGHAADGVGALAGDNGGAILNNGTLTLTTVSVTGSSAGTGGAGGGAPGGNGGNGGGIYNSTTGTLTISNSTISGDQTGAGGTGTPAGTGGSGGGVYNEGALLISGSTVSGNSGAAGGGVASAAGSVTLVNSTLYGNFVTGNGGGLLNSGTSNATLTSVTVTANRCDSDGDSVGEGGGVIQTGGGTFTLNNTIVAGNFKGMAVGVKQAETVTVSGSANVNGNILVRVTAAGMNNSPKDVHVAVSNGDSAATVAGKIVTALTGNGDVGGFFDMSIGTNPEDVKLTVKTAAANDATMHVKIFGNSTGILNSDSTHTTAGVAPSAGTKQIETLNLAGTTITSCTAGAGTITLTVTASGMAGSGASSSVSVVDTDDGTAVATKIRTFLATADPQAQNISGFFDIGGTGANVTFTRKTEAADDGTLVVSVTADSPCAGVSSASENTQAGVAPSAGTAQKETVTVSGGPVLSNGTIQVTVTATGMTGSPKTVGVAVTTGDSNSTVAGKIATVLNNDLDIGGFFTATTSTANVILTRTAAAADDPSIHVAIVGNATGINDADSTPTTAGVFQTANDINGSVTGTFNLIGTGGSGGLVDGVGNNQVGVNPTTVFAAGLANNGGPTQTAALKTTSPAIDKGQSFALTTLSANVADNVVTTVNVTAATSIAPGVVILIDTEQMLVVSKAANVLTVTRGANGSTAASHLSGANVLAATDQRGYARPANFDGAPPAAGDDSDIGAYEQQPQPAAPNAPDLDAASDTGTSSTDNLTSDTSPTFTITGVVNGAFVELLRDDDGAGPNPPVVVASGTAAGVSIQLTDPSVTSGSYDYTARQTVGGAPTSASSSALTVTIDTSTPAAPNAPNLDDASDTGTLNNDNLTNDTTPTFTIGNVTNGFTVYLLRDDDGPGGNPPAVVTSGTATGSSIQLTDPSAPQGVYVYTSRQSNGVNSTDSATGLTVTVDTTAPAAPGTPDLQSGSDTFGVGGTGTNSDNITSAGSRTFDIPNTLNGVRVELYRGATFIGFTTGNGATVTITDSTSPGDNTYSYTARQVDDAGNFAASGGLSVTIDTNATAAGVPDLQAASDSGPSSTDNYTNAASRSFDIPTTENGSLVQLYRGATLIASTTGTGGTVTLTDNSLPADGPYDYTSKQTDVAGNAASSNILTVTIDTMANAPGTPNLQDASDTGSSNTDNITGNATHSFDITSENGDLVELLRNGSPVSSTTAAGGSVTLSDTASLADNVYHYTARQTDLAGNVATSAGTLDVTIDTTAPSVVSDTRASSNPTSAASVDFTVTFSEDVTGVDTADFVATGSGGVTGASVTTVTPVNAKVYTVSVNTGSGDGSLRLDVINTDGVTPIKDAVNLTLAAGFTTGQVYAVSKSALAALITPISPNPRNSAVSSIQIAFNKSVTGFDLSDLTLKLNNGANLLTGAQTLTSADNVTFTLGNLAGITAAQGTYDLKLTAAGSNIQDSTNATLMSDATASWVMDTAAPTVTVEQAAGQADPATGPTGTTTISFTVTFNEPVTGLTPAEVTLGGTAGATVVNITGSGAVYTLLVQGMTQSGTVTASIIANAAQDAAGNGNTASTSADNTVQFNADNFTALEVNTTADTDDGRCDALGTGSGNKDCTLREAINAANADFGAETITFNSTVFASPGPYTISLLSALPDIASDVTIQGPGAKVLTVERNVGAATSFRIFKIASGTVSISAITITKGLTADGTAGNPGGDGGGILNSGTLVLTDVAVSGNQTGKGGNATTPTNGGIGGAGGGIFNNGTLTVVTSTISSNQTGKGGNTTGGALNGEGGSGGGIFSNGTLTITNSTISGNHTALPGTGGTGLHSSDGAGIKAIGTLTISNSTITANVAPGDSQGGGLWIGAGTTTIKSSIIAGNTSFTDSDLHGTVNSEGFNLIQSTSGATINETLNPGTNITGQDPQLNPLGENGGSTLTHSLQCTSPAIDKGKAFGLTNDQRGGLRPLDFADTVFPNAVGGDGTDMGAFETQAGGGCVPDAQSPNPQPTTNEDSPVTVQLKAVYSQNVQMTFSISQSPANGTLGAITNTSCTFNLSTTCTADVQYTPNADYNGADTFKFKATTNPGSLESDPADVNVTINSINDPPSFLLGPSPTVLEDAGPQSVSSFANTISVGPANEGGQTYQFLVTGNTNPGLFSAAPAIDSAGTLTYTSAANANGAATITVVMKDSGGGTDTSAPHVFTITVTSVNDAPTFTKGPDVFVDENTPLQTISHWATNISPGPANESGQTANFKVTDFTNPSLFSIGPLIDPSGNLTITPAPNASGTSTVKVVLRDNGGTANGGVDTSVEETFTITIREGGALQFSSATYSVSESGGNAVITISRTGGTAGTTSVQFATSNGTATAGSDYTAVSQTVTFNDGDTSKTVNIPITNDLINESSETVNLAISGITGSGELGSPLTAVLTIGDDDPIGGYLKFSAATYSVAEGGVATITVQRVGTLTQAVTVDYATADNSVGPQASCAPAPGNTLASSRCDYTSAFGQITFAAGDGADKTFTVLIGQDSYVEGPESLSLTLANPTNGASLITPSAATLTINDDLTEPPTNLVDDTNTFVEQLYRDFLNRPSDPSGKAFWVDNIDRCNDPARRLPGLTQAQCIEVQRINTAAAFFLSIEFQATGGTAYLTNKAAFGTLPTFLNFEPDAQAIGKGYVFGQPGAEAILEANKVAYFNAFVARSSFTAIYGGMSNTQYVDALIANTGVMFTPPERNALINGLNNATETRATVLRKIGEKASFRDAEFNRMFVFMEYVGFLRRDPDAPGFNFWLTKLNQFNGNYIAAEMIKAFISSAEYRGRFGQ